MFQFSLSTQQIIMWRSVPNTHVSKCPCLEAFSLVLCSILSLRYWESTFSEDFLCYTPAEACLLPTGCIMASQTPSVWLIQHTTLLVCTPSLQTAFSSPPYWQLWKAVGISSSQWQLITESTAPDLKIGTLIWSFQHEVWCEFGPCWVVDNLVTR